jgi:copper(I)-binding protein
MSMDKEADITTMKSLASVTIPPKGRLELKPGGIHLMLEGLKQPLKLGQKVRLVLRFADGDTQTLEATVRNQ